MKIEEQFAKLYCETNADEILSLISQAYIEGYRSGFKKSHDIIIEHVRFLDLGLPSGTLWASTPIHEYPFCCNYYNYVRESYNDVSELNIPTLADFQELVQFCRYTFNEKSLSKEVSIIGPSGERIQIDINNHLNRPENLNSHVRIRQGENVPKGTNMFWLKSDIKDNEAGVGVVDTDNKGLYSSTHFIGYKLPFLLVKKIK